jgi:hypothetical protein
MGAGDSFPRTKWQSVKLTIDLHLLLKLRICGIVPLPHIPIGRGTVGAGRVKCRTYGVNSQTCLLSTDQEMVLARNAINAHAQYVTVRDELLLILKVIVQCTLPVHATQNA